MAPWSSDTTTRTIIASALPMNATLEGLAAQVASLQATVDALVATPALPAAAANTWWLLSNGILVFFMQCGFGMLEAGSVTARATQNILLKNLMDTCIGCVMWWIAGYGIAYDGDNPFIGVASSSPLFLTIGPDMASTSNINITTAETEGYGEQWAMWWFQFAFAAASATIVSGAVAERAQLPAYLTYSSAITLLIYPVVAHWVWSPHGWLSTANPSAFLGGAIDFAGSGAVHVTGGVSGLVGAAIIGPRPGRFSNPKEKARLPGCVTCKGEHPIPALNLKGHSTVLQALGTFILWMGWYGFNAGSTISIGGHKAAIAGPVFVKTTLSAASGGLIVVILERYRGVAKMWDVGAMCNGILSGLVSITAGCATVPVWASVLHGAIGGIIFRAVSNLVLESCRIDDPLDAFAVHGACGMWGVLASGIFSTPHFAAVVAGHRTGGAIYGGARLLGANVIYLLSIVAWTAATSTIMFMTLAKLQVLRAEHSATLPDAGAFANAPDQHTFDSSKHGELRQYKPEAATATATASENSQHSQDTSQSSLEATFQSVIPQPDTSNGSPPPSPPASSPPRPPASPPALPQTHHLPKPRVV